MRADDSHEKLQMMGDNAGFGEQLKTRREEKGVSLDEVAQRLRIRRQFLQAMEEERLDDLPGETYFRGFLRSYAEFLDLDGEALLQSYRSRVPEPPSNLEPLRHVESELIEPVRLSSPAKRKAVLLLLVLVLVGVVTAAVVWLLLSPAPSSPPRDSFQPVSPETAPAGSTDAPILPDVTSHADEPVASEPLPVSSDTVSGLPHAESVTKSALPPLDFLRRDGSTIKIRASRSTRVDVVLDERPAQGYQLRAGSVLNWQAHSRLQLDIQDPAAVELWVDDRVVSLEGRTSLVMTSLPQE